jgi:hypothetical protein
MSDPAKPISLSLSALAREFNCTRDTMRKRLYAANVQVAENNEPQVAQHLLDGSLEPLAPERGLYLLRDAIRAWLPQAAFDNPELLDPLRRKAHYDAEHRKLDLERSQGKLIPREHVESEQARILQKIALVLDTLPDVIERDCGAASDVVKRIERVIDEVREQLYDGLAGDQ